jgi:hypothetical protein
VTVVSLADVAIWVFLAAGGVVCLLLGGLLLRSALSRFQLLRRLWGDDAEAVDVADVTPGTVAVSGTVRPTDAGTVPAPFGGGETVVAAGSRLRRNQGADGSNLAKIDGAKEAVPFVVEDGTGSVRVAADEDDVYHMEEEHMGKEEVDQSALRAWRDRNGLGDENPTTYREEFVAPGDQVYVYGDAVATDGGGAVGESGTTDGAGAVGGSRPAEGAGAVGDLEEPAFEMVDGGEDLVVSTKGRAGAGGGSLVGGLVSLFFGGMLVFIGLNMFLMLLLFVLG